MYVYAHLNWFTTSCQFFTFFIHSTFLNCSFSSYILLQNCFASYTSVVGVLSSPWWYKFLSFFWKVVFSFIVWLHPDIFRLSVSLYYSLSLQDVMSDLYPFFLFLFFSSQYILVYFSYLCTFGYCQILHLSF